MFSFTTSICIFCIITLSFGFFGAPLLFWSISLTIAAWVLDLPYLFFFLLLITIPLNVKSIRISWLSEPAMKFLIKMGLLPKISETEKTAIEAGSVWVDKEFFSGKPNFNNILSQKYRELNAEEKAFLDGPIEEICKKTDDWKARYEKDLSKEVWALLKKHKVFGMIIPKKYGGLEFSALTNSAVVGKIASRSMPLAVTAMVPNSLGPAELLMHYGTDEQKDYYLPRLADGREIPCFALTEPTAGSDAGAIQADGQLFKNDKDEIMLRLNFRKRYITLASVSTLIGLAFKCYDPENLLGGKVDLGITCALIPSDTKGITLGRRHDPLGTPFHNCPVNGDDVEISIDNIIGGQGGIGNGWRMLMDCLSAGRAISLPAVSTGLAKYCYRGIGAYATCRQQFGMSIGKFEGIEEPLAEIGGLTYLLEAARIYTCGGIESGEKPSVVSAIAKYHFTESARTIVNHSMDIAGGSAISLGPRNLFANAYISLPIAITVEGANILTRTMIIFGQGLIRCHPFVQDEVAALETNNLKAFDRAFWGHVGFVIRNVFRAGLLTFSRGLFAKSYSRGSMKSYTRKIQWASAVFSVLADLAMAGYGGSLKRKEKITGRLGDIASWMYLASTVIKRYETEGSQQEHKPLAIWSLDHSMHQIQIALEDVLKNIDLPIIKHILNGPLWFLFRLNPIGSKPTDKLGSKVARTMMTPGSCRDKMTSGIFIPESKEENLGRVENVFNLHHKTAILRNSLKEAVKNKKLSKGNPEVMLNEALQKNIINQDQYDELSIYEDALLDFSQVDAYTLDDLKPEKAPTPTI